MTDTVVILGAGGGVGRGITGELLAAGYRVTAVGRDRRRLDSLAAAAGGDGRLELLPGSVASDEEAGKLVTDLVALAAVPTVVVASLCGQGASARLLDQPGSFLLRTFEEDVASHFIAARHLIPLLAETGRETRYVVLSGPAAECAWSGYGHRSVAAGALRMLTLVMREEAKDLPVSVQQLQICCPVRTGGSCGCPEWLMPEDVGRRVVDLIAHPNGDDAVVHVGGYGRAVESGRV